MIRTINPCAAARTAEIMSRYRPIAPKPEGPMENDNSALPDGIRKSPYLRNVWAHLQARPTRTRKRGRSTAFAAPPPSVKRTRACLQGLAPPYQMANSSAKNLAMHAFTRPAGNVLIQPDIPIFPNLVPLKCGLDTAVTTLSDSVALPVLCRTPPPPIPKEISIDLNTTAPAQSPEELDFLPQLHEPAKPAVISPKPVRPVGSTVTIVSITEDHSIQIPVQADDVEAVVESESLPAIISDSRNKVRLTNSAFKEMVGQPECAWLDCAGGGSRRIGGEVVLHLRDSEAQLGRRTGFKGRVKIDWEIRSEKKSLNGFCSGVKLCSHQGQDCQYLWKIEISDDGDEGSKKCYD